MKSLQYVILRHEGIPDPHFDLMVEASPGGLLITWRSPAWPIIEETRLIRLGEHRRDYLTYEGAISKDRGSVRQVAAGTCELDWIDRYRCTLRVGDAPAIEMEHLDDDHWIATPMINA